jgi:acyl-CoA thioesterase I
VEHQTRHLAEFGREWIGFEGSWQLPGQGGRRRKGPWKNACQSGSVNRRSLSFIFAVFLWLPVMVDLSACGSASKSENVAKSSGGEAASRGKPEPSPDAPESDPAAKPAPGADNRPAIVTFGDSLTAGVVPHAYPEYLQNLLDANGYNYRVVSGDTTTDGLARIGNVVAAHPKLVILEFGGNDGLRGIPVEATKANLQAMVTDLQAAKIPVVLAGITLPPNYGPDYVKPFTAMFAEVAKQSKVRLLPFLLVGVYQHPEMMQPDGIHPNEAGNKIVAQDVFQFIKPSLKQEAHTKAGKAHS